MNDLGQLRQTRDTHVFAYAGKIIVDGKVILVVAYETTSKTGHYFDIKSVEDDKDALEVIKAIGRAEKKKESKLNPQEDFGLTPQPKQSLSLFD